MELSKFDNGIALHNNAIRHVIEKDELYIMHEDGYSYTVGMRYIGSSELIIYGQHKSVAEEMFKIIYAAARDLDLNTVIKNVFEPAPGLSNISEKEKKGLFYAARTHYGDWSFSAVKISMQTNKSNGYDW